MVFIIVICSSIKLIRKKPHKVKYIPANSEGLNVSREVERELCNLCGVTGNSFLSALECFSISMEHFLHEESCIIPCLQHLLHFSTVQGFNTSICKPPKTCGSERDPFYPLPQGLYIIISLTLVFIEYLIFLLLSCVANVGISASPVPPSGTLS